VNYSDNAHFGKGQRLSVRSLHSSVTSWQCITGIS